MASLEKSKRKLKEKAWSLFSEYIRRKESDCFGNVQCVTCNNSFYWKDVHAGHFLAGRNSSILFEENGVHPQCTFCNTYNNGASDKYYAFMARRYGKEEINRLTQLKHKTIKRDVSFYELLIEDIKRKIGELSLPLL